MPTKNERIADLEARLDLLEASWSKAVAELYKMTRVVMRAPAAVVTEAERARMIENSIRQSRRTFGVEPSSLTELEREVLEYMATDCQLRLSPGALIAEQWEPARRLLPLLIAAGVPRYPAIVAAASTYMGSNKWHQIARPLIAALEKALEKTTAAP